MTINVQQIAEKYLYLFADCFLVKGYLRTMILDVGRQGIYFVNNSYNDLLEALGTATIGEVYDMLDGEDDKQEFEAFLKYLIENELATLVDDIKLFPAIDTAWHHTSIITNAIIDTRNTQHDYEGIFAQLDELRCWYLQLRSYEVLSAEDLLQILSCTENKHFRNIQIITKYDEEKLSHEAIEGIMKKYPLITITVHSSPFNNLVKNEPLKGIIDLGLGFIMYIKQPISSCSACGIINSKSFNIPTLGTLTENIHFNGCLNRKIAVDENGEIKNCPSMATSYGHVSTVSLQEVALNAGFKSIWNINKDKIEVCKDCEYRYICTDCRAYTKTAGDLYAKPAKCSYNPYTGQWQD